MEVRGAYLGKNERQLLPLILLMMLPSRRLSMEVGAAEDSMDLIWARENLRCDPNPVSLSGEPIPCSVMNPPKSGHFEPSVLTPAAVGDE